MKMPTPSGRLVRRLAIIAVYLASVIGAMAVVAYGLAWKQYPVLSAKQNVRNGGYDGEATVTGLRGFGIGIYKDYYLKTDRFPREISIPAVIANALLVPDGRRPVYVGDQVKVGDRVRLHTVGGNEPLYPVIIQLAVIEKNSLNREILNWDLSSRRFEQIEAQGSKLGDMITSWAKYVLLLGPIGHLLIWLATKYFERRRQISPN